MDVQASNAATAMKTSLRRSGEGRLSTARFDASQVLPLSRRFYSIRAVSSFIRAHYLFFLYILRSVAIYLRSLLLISGIELELAAVTYLFKKT